MMALVPVATVGGNVRLGTQAEADAAQLDRGDAVRYRRHKSDKWLNAIVDFTWWYESVVVKIKDGPNLHVDCGDEIERLTPMVEVKK